MAKSLFFCVLLLAAPVISGAVRAATSTAAVIAETHAALDKGDAAEAQRMADNGLKDGAAGAERGQLLLSRGLARELLGAHDGALADFSAAIAIREMDRLDRAQALLQRGFLLDGMGRLDEAARDYGAVIGLKTPLTPTARNNRGNIHRRQGRLAEAKADYLAALAGSARPQYPYYGLGQIAEAQHDGNAARGFYAKAVAVDPGYRLASERLAELGGPPDGALSEPDVIHLRQPLPKAETATPQPDGPTTAVALKPPTARKPRPLLPTPPRLGLRPALDASSPAAASGLVQLGAWRSEAEARDGWNRIQGRASGLLDGAAPRIVTADLPGKGRYWRLRTGPAAGQTRAQFCAALVAHGLACLLARD